MQYNAKTVLRLIPNVTLARLFAPYSAFAGFAWDAGSKGSADRIFERWQTMEDGEVRAVGRILRQAHCLATPRGTRALIEAGRDRGLDLAEELAALSNAPHSAKRRNPSLGSPRHTTSMCSKRRISNCRPSLSTTSHRSV
jgi:hypothetical protein